MEARTPPGYVVLPWSAMWVTGRSAIDSDSIVLDPTTIETIDLYERDRDMQLVTDLASVETPDHARAFARRYGLLTRGPDAPRYREPFSLWKTVATQTKRVLDIAVALRDDDVDRLDDLVAPYREHSAVEEVGGIRAKASVLAEGILNDGLRGGDVREGVISAVRVTQEAVHGPSAQWHFAPQFGNLVGFAYHRLAQAVSYRSPDLLACAQCARITWRSRPGQLYCADRPCADTAKKRRQRERRAS
jgi:hypothetical protein